MPMSFRSSGIRIKRSVRCNSMIVFSTMAESTNGLAITRTFEFPFERRYMTNSSVLIINDPIVKSRDAVSSKVFLSIVFMSLNIKSFLNRMNGCE